MFQRAGSNGQKIFLVGNRVCRLWVWLIALFVCATEAFAQPVPERYQLAPDVETSRLTGDVWVHTSYREMPGWGRVLSNGLIVVSGRHALLIDTAWNEEQTALILQWVSEKLGATVERAVITHAHDDRIGGIGVLKRAGIPTYANRLTAEWAEKQGFSRPDSVFTRAQELRIGDRRLEAYFPGGGHTPDNIVVWLGDERLLFGGCMVKEAGATSPGNLADAVLAEWPASIRRVMARYPVAQIVVTSHGPVGDAGLLRHTLTLLEKRQ